MQKYSIHCLFVILIFLTQNSFAQKNKEGKFIFNGFVYGYTQETSKKIFKKEKKTTLEGILQNAQINISTNGLVVQSLKTNKKGDFEFKISYGEIYSIEFSKPEYSTIVLIIDLTNFPKNSIQSDYSFTEAQIILYSGVVKGNVQKDQELGKFFYNSNLNYIDFIPSTSAVKNSNFENAIHLMKVAVDKNKDNEPVQLQVKNLNSNGSSKQISESGNVTTISSFKLKPTIGFENIKENNIKAREIEINEALEQLKKDKLSAITPEEIERLNERESLLNAAISELSSAKKMIELQKSEIVVQQKLLILSAFSLLLFSVFLYMLYKHNKEKKIANALLAEKNKKITDSINYANKIQRSILPKEIVLNEIFQESFMLFKPKDIVSGDFPFLFRKGNNVFIAAVDCTGHGVPGALLSIIGALILNELVRYENLSAAEINDRLHTLVVRTLRQGEASGENERDGMDIAMCKINLETGKLEFSGAHRPLYILRNELQEGQALEELKGDKYPIGGVQYRGRKSFTNFETILNRKDRIFIFTDGFPDQFGGTGNEPDKLGAQAIRKILVDNRNKNIKEIKSLLGDYFDNWMGNQKQIDDVLFIGIEF